ncbi:uncharacterized protein KY384_007286 [Bacidia gigantensis]|uniref:uncharacterized protein n=1 Tax=Bacidia gigantensis TaxID=2732470 RepID=UPI001D05A26C|nr:uncharacterized protein KY384_007286 [Bacidia gigantensis]KAG8528368.1 hypothetical protein KY384_007286 [Bacidia gigantensis]
MKINASVLYLASLATAKILQDVAQVGHHIAERAEVAKLDEKCPHCKTVTITSNTAICYPTSPLLPPPSSTCESDISGAGGAATAGSGGSGGSANGLPSGPGNSLSSGFGATPAGSLSGQQTPSISGIGGPSGTGGGPGSPSISGLPGQGNGAGGSSGGPGSPTNSGLNPPGGVSSPGASASGGGAGGAGGSPGVSPGPSGSNGAGGGGGPASPSPTPSGGSGSTGLPPRLKFLIAFSQPLNPGARSTSGFASRNGSQDDCKTSTGYQLNSDGILSVYNRDDLVYSATTGVASAVFTPSTSPGDITTFWGINNGTLEWRNAEFLGNLAVFCTFPTSDDITTYFTVAPPSECTRVYLTAEPAAACPGYIGDPESQTELGPQASSGGASVPATPIITSPSGPSGEPSAGASISDNGPPASGSDNGAPGPSESPSASVPGAGAASPGVSGSSTSGSSTASTASSASATPTFSTNYTCDLGTAFNQFYNGTGKRLPINNPAAWDSNIYPRITQTIDASQTFCQARTSCENAAVTNSYLTYEVAFDYSVPAWQCAIYHSTLNDSSYVTDLSSNYGHGEAYYGLPNCTVRNFKQFYQGFGTRLVDNNPGNDNYAVWPSPLSFDYPLESYDNCSFVTECRRRTRFYNYHMFDITADYSTHTWRCLLWHNQLNASNYQPWTQSTGFKNSPGRFYSFPVTDPSVCNSRFSLLNNGTGLRLLDSNPANDQPGTYPPLNSVITAATANNNPCTAIDLCSQVGQNQCPPYHTLYLNVLSNGNFNCTVYHGDLTSTGGGSYFTADSSIGQFYTYHNSTYPDNYPVCP